MPTPRIVTVFGVLILATCCCEAQDQFHRDAMTAIADSFDNNRNGFASGSVEIVEESLDNDRNALGSASHVARYIFSGNQAIYERAMNAPKAEPMPVNFVDFILTKQLSSVRIVTNGRLYFLEEAQWQSTRKRPLTGVNMSAGSDGLYKRVRIPFDLGFNNASRDDLASNLRQILNQEKSCKLISIKEDQKLEGASVIQVDAEFKNGTRSYWIDLERGAVPLRKEDRLRAGPIITTIYSNIKWIEGHGWLPLTMETTDFSTESIIRTTIVNYDFKLIPDNKKFVLRLLKPSSIINELDRIAYNNLKVVDLNSLPRLGSQNAFAYQPTGIAGPGDKLPQKLEPPRYFLWISSIGILLVAAIFSKQQFSRARFRKRLNRAGFTLIELIVVISIISVLASILIPAVLSVRETSRKAHCFNNLKQIGLAISNYESANGCFPPTWQISFYITIPEPNTPVGHRYSPLSRILPYLEKTNLYNSINFGRPSVFSDGLDANFTSMLTAVDGFMCPSDRQATPEGFGRVNYRFCSGPFSALDATPDEPFSNHGAFGLVEVVRPGNISDGLSNTVAASERLQGGWTPGNFKAGRDYFMGFRGFSYLKGEACLNYCNQVQVSNNQEARGGESWMITGYHFTSYNHLTTPNSLIPDCSLDQSAGSIFARSSHLGNFPATSLHSKSVCVLFLDGHVASFSNTVAGAVWKGISTVAGSEVISDND